MEGSANHDFISILPDPIIHHILGLLNTKQAVQMCLLSKRWEHLWTSLPYLNLNFDDFLPLRKELQDEEEWSAEKTAASRRFVTFVTALLLRREPLNLDMFRLSCVELSEEYVGHERDWIHYTVIHHTRILSVSFSGSLPFCIFSCKSIEELDINNCGVNISGTVSLPKLRRLAIRKTGLVKNGLKNMLSGCRLLDHIWLEEFYFDESIISHEKLQHLISNYISNFGSEGYCSPTVK